MIRTEGKSSSDAAEVQGTLPWILWVKGIVDYIIQQKMGLGGYEIAIDPFAEPDPLKNAAAITMLVAKAVITPNEARKRVGEELRPEPEADKLGVITGTGFVPVGIPSAQAGLIVDENGKLKPHPTPAPPPPMAPNANRGGTPVAQEAGSGRSAGKNPGTPSGKESLDGAKVAKKKVSKANASRISPDLLTPESHQAIHQIQQHVETCFQAQLGHALGIMRERFHKTLGDALEKRKFGNVQFDLSPPDAQKILSIPVDGTHFAPKARDMKPHVTVLWGLHPEVTTAQLNELTRGIGNVDITVGKVEAFPEGEHGVPLVIRVDSPKLHELRAKLETLPHTKSFLDYKPHICIAYLTPDAPTEQYVATSYPHEGDTITLSQLFYSRVDYGVDTLEKLLTPSMRIKRIEGR